MCRSAYKINITQETEDAVQIYNIRHCTSKRITMHMVEQDVNCKMI